MPIDFAMVLEHLACGRSQQYALRRYCAMFVLMTMASLRFSDVREVTKLRTTESAICGMSIDQKAKNADLVVWAAPLKGFSTATFLVRSAH